MEKFGLGKGFIDLIKLLNHSPSEQHQIARILSQGDLSTYPPLRSHLDISGLGARVYKTVLYADDILLFLTNLEISVPAVMSLIEEFGSISGYYVNFDKTLINQLEVMETPLGWQNISKYFEN